MAEVKEDGKPKSASKWLDALTLAKNDQKKWEERGDKIVKRYRDDRGTTDNTYDSKDSRYNILYSNIQVLFPAVYGKKPKAQAERRYKDSDPVGRTAAEILERALQYEIDQYSDFDSAIRFALLDRLLPGRGVAWVRYQNDDLQITDDADAEPSEATLPMEAEQTEGAGQVGGNESSPCDYVFWKDFRCSPARTWEEVTWVARRVYMCDDEGEKRFPEDWKSVPKSHEPVGLDDLKSTDVESLKKAIIWEIWDLTTKQVIWISEGYQNELDRRDDPLGLDSFFPCPKPLYATVTSDTLNPVADYVMYQDQARELDEITSRISSLVRACKVVGVYDTTSAALARMLDEGSENVMIPVEGWAGFSEKGGLKGSVDWLPLDMVINTLTQLYAAREQCKQVIYEVTGLSDIIRGASNAQETATAQQIKSQYGSIRLKDRQMQLANWVSDLLRIKAQIMVQFYSPQTLIDMSGILGTMDGKDPQLVQQAIQLLKSDTMRNFKIEVASDSLVEIDEQGEKESRMEFLSAAGGFIQQAVQAPPSMAPLLGEMLMFGVRGFKAGRPIEAAFDEFMAKMKQEQEQPPGPSPEEQALQAEQQQEQQRLAQEDQQHQRELQQDAVKHQQELQHEQQMEAIRQQSNQVIESQKMEFQRILDAQKASTDMQIEQMRLLFEEFKLNKQESTKIVVAEIGAEATLTAKQDAAADQASKTE